MGAAQGLSDTIGTIQGGGDYLMYALMAAAALVFFIVVSLILRKLSLGKSSDPSAGLTYLDVTGLKKRGMLTDEEAARVRAAMSRQVEKLRSDAEKPQIPGEVGLLTDPEVRRLEALAEARARAAQTDPRQALQNWPAGSQDDSGYPAVNSGEERPVFSPRRDRPVPANSPGLPGLEEIGLAEMRAVNLPPEDDDVALPPDVLKMVELGLITPEELAAIRERIRAKRDSVK